MTMKRKKTLGLCLPESCQSYTAHWKHSEEGESDDSDWSDKADFPLHGRIRNQESGNVYLSQKYIVNIIQKHS